MKHFQKVFDCSFTKLSMYPPYTQAIELTGFIQEKPQQRSPDFLYKHVDSGFIYNS